MYGSSCGGPDAYGEEAALFESERAQTPLPENSMKTGTMRTAIGTLSACAFFAFGASFMTADGGASGGRHVTYLKEMDTTQRTMQERTAAVPERWTQGARADADSSMQLHFAMKHRDDVDMEKELLDVSTPGNPRYGAHFSKKQMDALTQPADATVTAVESWLGRQGMVLSKANKQTSNDFVTLEMTVGQAEALLQAEYYEYTNADGETAIRTPSYSVPSTVDAHLDFVAPTVQFPGLKASVHRIRKVKAADEGGNPPWMSPTGVDSATQEDAADSADSYSYITPDELKTMYNYEGVTANSSTENTQVVTAFLDEYYCTDDLQTFYGKFSTDLKDFTIAAEVGSTTDDHPGCGDEANLDVQYITSTAAGVNTEFWSFSGYSPDKPSINEPFLDFMTYLNNLDTQPSVVSTSYGEDEGSTSTEYATRVQAEFMKAGMRGVTLLFASGDSGVASMFSGKTCTQFTPQWPAGSPWVTAVGATSGVTTETAADFSSGGFSNRWAMPDYQRDTVTQYLEENEKLISTYVLQDLLPPTMYTPNGTMAGRAFPDVSAAGEDFMIVLDGNVYTVDGTSASTPVFAGVVSLVNEQRHKAGLSSLGFLNPMIYTYGSEIFNDVQSGNNPGCSTTGFEAVEGWDPVTGFGSPDYQKFVDIALKMP
eukprot:CAMPEP_0182567828 /NCGR_PEP_ID=MMETSP1324-20130603/8939_1 /TAXON_ID=236786 /ORGANISM="Florenciella sp., Strain RCC1587" /LENGTH=653 /DNA_ID=CAMNT_0024781885 /DNA_START=33 /DNA_END=1994 /DNA_ORIENTATION=+